MNRSCATEVEWVPGTAGDDLLTVHKVRDGTPLCGAVGKVAEWRRKVTCRECLSRE